MLDNEINKNEVKLQVRSPMIGSLPMECGSSTMSEMPRCPKGGLIVKVAYAGVCYAEGHIRKGQFRPQLPGIINYSNTPLHEGIEVAGTIHEISNSLPNCNFTEGDNVIIYPTEDMVLAGYQEYVAIDNAENVLQVPKNLPLEVAAMLPGSALSAYNAVLQAIPHVRKLQQVKSCVNVLIVGAGSLGLWTLQLAHYLMGEQSSNIKLYVADNSIDKLITAQEHECHDIIHWCEEDHEQYIIERTLDGCRGGVDIVVDFISSPRTMMRSLKVLNREGLILVGGNAMTEVSINLNTLAAKQQSIVGIPKGDCEQLRELMEAVAEKKVSPPQYSVHNLEDAKEVFEELSECRLTGRAILRFGLSSTTHTAHATDNC